MSEQKPITLEEVIECHKGGKIETTSKIKVKNKRDLAVVYTPWVAKICEEIARDPSKAKELTIKKNTVAVLSDGSAILGLGDLGPEAAMPVMEGKAMLFKNLANVDAFPICINAKTIDEIVFIAKALEPTFGGINLEDISAPRCFEIEERLKREMKIPVFHDDQHGTAVVALAALYNALKITSRNIKDLKIVVSGAGAAAVAVSKIFMSAGAKNIILCDRNGAIYQGRTEHMNSSKEEIAKISNPNKEKGNLKEILKGADVFIGLSGPNLLEVEDLSIMAKDPIIFAMSNPTPEVDPIGAKKYAAVVATGRSDFPNQINNVLCFPGLFRGLLDSKAEIVTEEMKLSAAKAIASLVSEEELSRGTIIPDALDPRVAPAVAEAVKKEVALLKASK